MDIRELPMGRKLAAAGGILLAVLAGAWFLMPRDWRQEPAALRIGAGDDITGVLLEEVDACAREGGEGDLLIGSYLFVDCCASAAQWALQAEEIDMGFYCAQAAMEMARQTDAFEIYSPIIMNGEVLAWLQDPEGMSVLGIPRKRSFLRDIARSAYPQIREVVEVSRVYLPFFLENGQVDGALMDVRDAARAAEELRFSPAGENGYISYCLVVRKDIVDTAAFRSFLEYYAQAVDRLNDPARLVEAVGADEDFWRASGLEFLHVS